MTAFQINEQNAKAQVAELLAGYGLEITQSTSGSYTSPALDEFALDIRSKPYPVKGNKALMAQLQADGFHIFTWRHSEYDLKSYAVSRSMVFIASKTIKIKTQEVQK